MLPLVIIKQFFLYANSIFKKISVSKEIKIVCIIDVDNICKKLLTFGGGRDIMRLPLKEGSFFVPRFQHKGDRSASRRNPPFVPGREGG